MTALRVGTYARAVEEALNRARGRPAVLSPRDWARVADWSARGVPLSVVLEALEETAARLRHRGNALRGLALVAPAVEETWRAIADGRPAPGCAAPSAVPGAEAWREAGEGRPPEDALARWLAGARVRIQAGDAPAPRGRLEPAPEFATESIGARQRESTAR